MQAECSMRFQPGRSGNPGGKVRGTRHRATLAAEALLEGEAEALTRKAIELAKTGDTVALRLCLDRILPVRKAGRTIKLNLPTLRTTDDVMGAIGRITEAVSRGLITPEEGQSLAGIVEQARSSIELVEIERRLVALESQHDT
jgi:hypothetical protein